MSYEMRELSGVPMRRRMPQRSMRRPFRPARPGAPPEEGVPPLEMQADAMPVEAAAPDTTSPAEPEPIGDQGLGWSVKYLTSPAGHELITTRAIGPASTIDFAVGGVPKVRTLTAGEIRKIVEGNTKTDLGWRNTGVGVAFAFHPSEQKRHALRATYGQSQPAALVDIVNELRRQHAVLSTASPAAPPLEQIGATTHLIQDSYSPAHTCRRQDAGWCITYIRNYGRGGLTSGGVEHGVPTDDRDRITHPNSMMAQAQATRATREYLAIAFKTIYGRGPFGDAAVAAREAVIDMNAFVSRHFRACFEPEGHRRCP
jgi:hypothetical protein